MFYRVRSRKLQNSHLYWHFCVIWRRFLHNLKKITNYRPERFNYKHTITINVVTVNLSQCYEQIGKQYWHFKSLLNVGGSVRQKNTKTAFVTPAKAHTKTISDKKSSPSVSSFFNKKSTPMTATTSQTKRKFTCNEKSYR